MATTSWLPSGLGRQRRARLAQRIEHSSCPARPTARQQGLGGFLGRVLGDLGGLLLLPRKPKETGLGDR